MSNTLAADDSARILALRAARLRAVSVAADEAVVWIAQFPLADETYAVPLSRLRAAIPLRQVRAVPLSAPHVVGTLLFQGELITALSLASLVGVRGWQTDPSTLLVVDVGEGRSCAVDCEAVPRPVTVARKIFEGAEVRAASNGTAELSTDGRKPMVLIDLPALLAAARGGVDEH
jgi:purine-binding chemotaxis protein CheW